MVKEFKTRKLVARVSQNEETECLGLLKSWVNKQPHLPYSQISDRDLLHFLHCCHYSVEQAKKVVDAYYTIRTNTEFFNKRDFTSQEFKNAIANMYFFQFENKTKQGENILYFKLVNLDPAVFDYLGCVRYGMATMDVYLQENDRVPGYQIIYDMEGLKLGHMVKLSAQLSLVKQQLMYVQEALPFNLSGVHLMNTHPIVESLMNLMKPMMNSELIDMMMFYKPEEVHLMYEIIPQEILPKEYGGKAPSLKEQTEKARTMLVNAEKFIKEKETQVVDERKRLNYSHSSADLGLSGSFKKLELD